MNEKWVDFRAVKSTVSMQMVLDHYGLKEFKRSADELRGRCPIHKGEGTDTFRANTKKNAFQCFSCKAQGNILDLVAALETCSVRDAALKLQSWFSIPESTSQPDKDGRDKEVIPTEEPGKAENKPLSFQLKGIDHNHPYLAGRGINQDCAEKFGIGFYAGRGSMNGRIVIPIHNEIGELVAYAGRALNDFTEPKYLFPAGFHKSLELFNLYEAIADGGKTVVLVEGFFGCIRVEQAGWPAVALMGSSLSEEQMALITKHFLKAIMLFDGDEAGRRCDQECLLKLAERVWVHSIRLPDGVQPDHIEPEELAEILG